MTTAHITNATNSIINEVTDISPSTLETQTLEKDNPIDDDQYQRRFRGTQALYGDDKFISLTQAHVIVIGIGGVGTWAAEGLARTAVGELTLIDLDVLVASNVNRQLPALDANFGRSKVAVMAERLSQINPRIQLNLVDDFLTADNVSSLLPSRAIQPSTGTVVVLDCTDDMSAKLAIALHCRFNKLKLICAGGAGGKTDPLKVTVSDLREAYQDPLLARLRSKLRQDYNINKQLKEKFGIRCVYSTQPPKVDKVAQSTGAVCQTGGLHCGGYGSAVVVTSVVAMVMVSEAIALLKN